METEKKGTPKVEPREFAWIPKPGNPKTFKNQPYAKVAGCNRVLRDAADDFDITIWKLARLLGLPWLHQIYGWLDGTQRPCQMYMTRLVKLYQLRSQGLKLFTVHHIDWEGSGEIHLLELVTVMPDGTLSSRRQRQTLSPQDQELRDKWMSQSPR